MQHKRLFFLIAIFSVVLAVYIMNPSGLTEEELRRRVTEAVQDGDIRKVRLLIWQGADINTSDEKGKTLLEVAIAFGETDVARFLIGKSRDVNKKNARGMTPLGLVVGRHRNASEIPKAKDSDSYCERGYYFYQQDEFDRAMEDYSSAIRLNPESDTAYYCRGRIWAEKDDPRQAVADWKQAIELDWHNALHVHYTCRLLKSPDAELDRLIKDTAMTHLEDLECVSGYAVGGGGSPGDFYIASLIISNPFDEERFLQMAQNSNPVLRAMAMICLARQDRSKYEKVIHSLYTDTAEVEYMPGGCIVDRTTLGKLARSILDDPEVLDCWSAAHTDWIYDPSEDDSEREAAIKQQISVIQALIEKGAEVNPKDRSGETPLHYATENGGMPVAGFLIAHGADVNAKNDKGETPLHSATFWGYQQMIELLIAHGADINARTNEGQTAMDIAAQRDYSGLVTLLRERAKSTQ